MVANAASWAASREAKERRPLATAGERPTPGAAADLAVLHALADLFVAPCLTGDVLPRDAWTSDEDDDLRLARQVCETCPLLDECSEFGRTHKPRAGQWGRYRYEKRSKTL